MVDKDKWIQATNELKKEYHQLARQPFEEGEYAGKDDILQAMHDGKVFVFKGGQDLWSAAIIGLVFAAFFGVLGIFEPTIPLSLYLYSPR